MPDPFITVGGALLGGGALGALGKALVDYLAQQAHDRAALVSRREDQDDTIRGELWRQVQQMQSQVEQMQGKQADCERRVLALQRDLYLRDAHITLIRLRLEQHGISMGDVPEMQLTPFTATIVPTAPPAADGTESTAPGATA